MRVELRDEAREDLADAAYFYERQSSGLGDYFIDSLRDDQRLGVFASRRVALGREWAGRS